MFDLNSYNCPAQILFPHLKDKSSRNCILHELWSNLYQMHLEAERNDHALSPIWNYVNKMCPFDIAKPFTDDIKMFD